MPEADGTVEVAPRDAMAPPEPDQATAAVREGFDAARAAAPEAVAEAYFDFAGRPVRFEVVGRGLAERLFRPFEHLRLAGPNGPAALVVELWDEAETGVPCEGAALETDLSLTGAAAASDDGWTVAYRRPLTLISFVRREDRITGWVADSAHFNLYELGRPLHPQLLLWYQDQGYPSLHAALVADGDRGVLMGGAGGSGKSSAAISCLLDGLSYLSDDYVGLESRADGTFAGHSLYSSCHLEPDQVERFPTLAAHAIPGTLPEEEKSLVLLSEVLPERLGRRASIEAVVLPRVTGAPEPRLRPAKSGEALLRLAPSSILMLPHARGDLRPLADLVRGVPCWWLELGGAMERIPDRIREVLNQGAGA